MMLVTETRRQGKMSMVTRFKDSPRHSHLRQSSEVEIQ